jgi:hypothetical protein
MTAEQQSQMAQCREAHRAFRAALERIPGVKVVANNVEEQERASPFGSGGTDLEVAFYVVVGVAE